MIPNNMMEVVNSNDIIYLSTTMAVLNDVLLVIQSVFPPCYIKDSFLISPISFLPNQPTQGSIRISSDLDRCSGSLSEFYSQSPLIPITLCENWKVTAEL